jgi:hypothetical protein
MSALLGLGLTSGESITPTEWHSGRVDGLTRHELLRPFIGNQDEGASYLRRTLAELSRTLELDGADAG